jgi:hypothetical protein
MSRDSPVGIDMGYGLDGRDSIPVQAKDFSLLHSVQTGSGTHPASYAMGTGGCFPGVETSNAVRNTWSCTSTPHCIFVA